MPANGKNNIDRPVVIFRGFSIPTYFIFDGDIKYQGKREKEAETKERNHRYLKLANVPVEDFPITQVNDKWAVFQDDLEEEIKAALTESVFHEIRGIVADELAYDHHKQVLKNVDGAMRVIELAYEQGYKVPVFEQIVQKIDNLTGQN